MKKIAVNKKRLLKLGWPFIVLFALSLMILRERIGVKLDELVNAGIENYADRLYQVEEDAFSAQVIQPVECLIINDSKNEQSNEMARQLRVVLQDMRVEYDEVDLATEPLPELSVYDKTAITTGDLSVLGEDVVKLCDWVKTGGQLMSTGTFQGDAYYELLAAKAGVLNATKTNFVEVSGMSILNDFMLNSGDREFWYDEPTITAMDVSLTSDCTVYIKDVASSVPLLWEQNYGEGKFVMMNQVLIGKVSRGILCAAYSLLGDTCVYPVINGSAFYLDDFPAPVPSGEGKYITEEYGVGISSFYANIWWPDIMKLEDKYGIIHTGLIIVDYSDQVEAPFPKQKSTERFTYFGNMLLNHGGELGLHGYNHMPLCLEKYDYKGRYEDYKKWKSTEDMGAAVSEAFDFAQQLFPGERVSVYVPPSNVLSQEGREALKRSWTDLAVIASTYNEDEVEYSQEFEVAEDGIVETPRIVSGAEFGDTTLLAAFSELNFHYVQSHFLHPDDVLDEERGAVLGWGKMYENLNAYIDYIYSSAPNIRNLSGSGMGEAVREFDKLSVQREETQNVLGLNIGGFYKEAYFMVRMNEGTIGTVTGGELEHLSGNLYLLHATSDVVRIEKKQGR